MLIFHYRPVGTVPIVTWADGTFEKIVGMIKAADNGDIILSDYWAIGDTRRVHLDAIPADANGAFTTAMYEQSIDLVLMNEGYMEQEGIHFVVGQKDCLSQYGRSHNSNTDSYRYWRWNLIKTSLNKTTSGGYYYALPDTLKPIFKSFKVITAQSCNATANITDRQKVALFAAKEIFGSRSYSNDCEAEVLKHIRHYVTSSNRIKNRNASADSWLLRSPTETDIYVCNVYSSGEAGVKQWQIPSGISPFMCI